MDNIQITLRNSKRKTWSAITSFSLLGEYKKQTIFFCLLVTSLCIGYLMAYSTISTSILVLIFLISIPSVFAFIAYPKFGISVFLLLAYIIMFVAKLGVDFPLGTIMDGLEMLLIVGWILKQKSRPNWKIYKNPISVVILIWILYNILELLNPDAASRLAWLYTIRSIAIVALIYFVFLYHLLDIRFVRFILKLWLLLGVIGAVYAFKQEYIGFTDFEKKTLEDPGIYELYFIAGHWRKFSIFSDPVAFAYNMVISSIICLCLITGPLILWKKIMLSCFIVLFQIAMLFSGTRGAFVLAPIALILFSILKYNRKVMFYVTLMGVVIGCMVIMPTSSPNLQRFQSAFWPSYDASYNLRKENQKKIQPYIISHPMGGGLGSTGVWGLRFAPNSPLAHFPPDSGYVRVAVEQGWIGLFLFCTFMFIILKTGIEYYYKIQDPELKSYCLAMILVIFVLNIGNYPQEALVQFPISIYFYLTIALINVTLILDNKKRITISLV